MSFNLLDLVKDQVTGQLVKHATGALGESEGGIQKALGGIFPSILGSMISKGSDADGGAGLMDMIKGVDPGIVGNMAGMLGGSADEPSSVSNIGGGLLKGLMGDKLGGAADLISKMSGIKSGSAMSLFKLAAPFLTGIIGKKVADDGLDVGGLVGMLTDQKDSVSNALPSGMGSLMGLGSLLGSAKDLASGAVGMASGAITGVADKAGDLAGSAANATRGAVTGASNIAKGAAGATVGAAGAAAGAAKSGASSLFKWLIPALIALAAIYFISTKMCAGTTVGDAVSSTIDKGAEMTKDAGGAIADGAKAAGGAVVDGAKTAGNAVADGANAVGSGLSAAFSKVDDVARKALSGITFAAGSAGKQMMDYIDGGGKGEGTFRFKNLNFESASARIAGTSGAEVDNLAAILKAYPDVNVVIEGHTDSDGEEAANVTLSESRAASVKARLVALGIDASRVATKGYGETMPIADNNTAAGKAENRRIEVKIAG